MTARKASVLFLFFFSLCLCGKPEADMISGFMELNYSSFNLRQSDSSGLVTHTAYSVFSQRYNLNLNTALYPNLRLLAGGLFEKDMNETTVTNANTKTTTTILNPFFDLTLANPLYSATVGFNRRDARTVVTGLPGITLLNEDYHAMFGWKPDGFPALNVLARRTNTFDKDRVTQDATNDSVLLNSNYVPAKGIDLRYQLGFNDQNDKLNDLDVSSIQHTGRAAYSAAFFNKRVSLNTSYDFFRRTTDTSQSGTGNVSFQLFPAAGLSAVTEVPIFGALDSNPSLIDGNLTAGSGINIGLPPLIGGDTRPRNMGLDFLSETELNNLLLWVDRPLPSEVASSFSWDIYTSTDNQTWTLIRTGSPAAFGPFQNRFEIDFPNVKTRFIKVVTRPLLRTVQGALNFPIISVTEFQAFIKKPAAGVRGTTVETTHTYNFNARTRILDNPLLYHEFFYFWTNTSGLLSSKRYTISNALSMSHRLSSVFS
jgi:hypothetical protein